MSPTAAATMLRIAAVGSFIFAVAMAIAVQGDPIGGVDIFLSLLIDGSPGASGIAGPEGRLSLAVAGGVFAGLAAMLFFVTAPGIEQDVAFVKRGSIIALLVWYFVDSGASIAAGVTANALANTALLGIYLIPLLMARAASGAPEDGLRA